MRSTLCKGRTRRRHRSSKGFLPSSWILMAIISGSLMWFSTTHAIKIQADQIHSLPESQARADVIRDTFKRGWKTYRAHAWGHDEIGALSLKPSNTRNGWGATLVDSLSTLQVMGLSEEYAEAVKHVHRIDFTKTNDRVSVFESTIRYVGGFLAAYEGSAQTEPILLEKAVELANKLMHAWQNHSILPYSSINFTNYDVYAEKEGGKTNLAEAGSLLLEFHTLSKYTSNKTYFDKAEMSMKAIMNNEAVWPGLHSVGLYSQDARPMGAAVTWGPAADSFYEYLNKYSLLTGNIDPSYLNHWALAVDSSIKHLIKTFSLTQPPENKSTFSSESNDTNPRIYLSSRDDHGYMSTRMTHLDCFVGGNFMLGGKMLRNQTIVDYGLKLTATCADSYFSTPVGVGPEIFEFDPNANDRNGFIAIEGYLLRPESMFYAYRITGDPIWQARAWNVWQAIVNCCQVSEATGLFAPIQDVNKVPTRNFSRALRLLEGVEDPSGEKAEYGDYMESFWWGETLKYFYLIFSKPDMISLDEFVLTTEIVCSSFGLKSFSMVRNFKFFIKQSIQG
ncbi:hypothetical protein CROQUDRAFT_96768 [Cronartium quercuum f. sp. fusiforme G11]|uniref:alpha-1,2-Mannosidase n=1 Tax=Cronartium quercuum f. sp. fusiforme G11 TaxID=708437 RepID=A0A9P6NBX1_9BASI|nr:hypothetical protein CROQUDRAFT_96768 [Cronartium quercuum f. sp. fusiforme G11]